MGQKINQNLKQRRSRFDFVTIRFVSKKQAFSKKESQHRMKNVRVKPIRRSRAKVAVGLFWNKCWPFWPLFLDINFRFVLPIIYINMDGQTNFKVDQT